MLELEEGEYIVGYIRKHWIMFVIQAIGTFLLLIFPIVFLFWPLNSFLPYIPRVRANQDIGLLLWSLWTVAVLMKTFSLWTLYYLECWVVTNRKLVEQEQQGFFKRKVSTLELEHIQDITISTDGMIETFIGFGSLSLENAGDFENFGIKHIKNPEASKRMILDAQNELRLYRNQQKYRTENITQNK